MSLTIKSKLIIAKGTLAEIYYDLDNDSSPEAVARTLERIRRVLNNPSNADLQYLLILKEKVESNEHI